MQQCRLARSCPGAAGPPGRDTTALSRPVTSVRRAVTRRNRRSGRLRFEPLDRQLPLSDGPVLYAR